MDIFDGMSSRARLSERADFPPRANIYDRQGQPLAEEAGLGLQLVRGQARHAQCLMIASRRLADATLQQISTLRGIFANYLAETRFHVAEMDEERYARYREALGRGLRHRADRRPLQQGS